MAEAVGLEVTVGLVARAVIAQALVQVLREVLPLLSSVVLLVYYIT